MPHELLQIWRTNAIQKLYPNELKYWKPKTINFPLGKYGKLIILGIPILKHFRERKVVQIQIFVLYM